MIKHITQRLLALSSLKAHGASRQTILTDRDEAAIGELVKSEIFKVIHRSNMTVSAHPDGSLDIKLLNGQPVDSGIADVIEDIVTDEVTRILGLVPGGGSAGWVAGNPLPKITPYNI